MKLIDAEFYAQNAKEKYKRKRRKGEIFKYEQNT